MNNQEKSSEVQFNRWAKFYDKRISLPFKIANSKIQRIINAKNAEKILDIGCGTGILLEMLNDSNQKYELHGIDISPKMVEITNCKLNRKFDIVVGSAQKLPYADNYFDVVSSCTSFHHYPESQEAIGEMFRVLKPEGIAIIMDPGLDGIARKIICKSLNFICNEKDVKMYKSIEMRAMFENSGFKNCCQEYFTYYKLITIGTKR